MKRTLRARSGLGLTLTCVLLVALITPSSSAPAPAASLAVSPDKYVAGQALTFSGNLGVAGQRRIHLQYNMGRGLWNEVEGSSALTTGNGSFRFTHPAPGMIGIQLRVASGRYATPARTFDAKSQDLTLSVDDEVPGVSFAILVDTTPTQEDTSQSRHDLPPPAFPGRTLTLQQRVAGDQWATLKTTTTDAQGEGSFTVSTIDAVARAGALPLVFRVRQEDWTEGGNSIGWFPSFPLVVDVSPSLRGPAAKAAPVPAGATATSPVRLRTSVTAPARAGQVTAGKTYRWGNALWDFAWEYGESLTSRPARGTVRRGWWLDASDGSGRVAKHNGQLTFDSQRNWRGPGDVGTTTATLQGNARAYGRWETKLRLKRMETDASDYRARIELVPARASDYRCGAQNITVADVAYVSRGVRIGVRSRGGREWTATRSIRRDGSRLAGTAAAFAVEVTKRHITWFVDGRAVGTVRSRAAVSDVPMTLRLSLVGAGTSEMNKTQLHSDWQRSFSLKRGRFVTDGDRLRRKASSPGC